MQPPAIACPLIAATSGFSKRRSFRRAASSAGRNCSM
jgi:hypothetical protein